MRNKKQIRHLMMCVAVILAILLMSISVTLAVLKDTHIKDDNLLKFGKVSIMADNADGNGSSLHIDLLNNMVSNNSIIFDETAQEELTYGKSLYFRPSESTEDMFVRFKAYYTFGNENLDTQNADMLTLLNGSSAVPEGMEIYNDNVASAEYQWVLSNGWYYLVTVETEQVNPEDRILKVVTSEDNAYIMSEKYILTYFPTQDITEADILKTVQENEGITLKVEVQAIQCEGISNNVADVPFDSEENKISLEGISLESKYGNVKVKKFILAIAENETNGSVEEESNLPPYGLLRVDENGSILGCTENISNIIIPETYSIEQRETTISGYLYDRQIDEFTHDPVLPCYINGVEYTDRMEVMMLMWDSSEDEYFEITYFDKFMVEGNDYIVKTIASSAFANVNASKIILPNSIETISNAAFVRNPNLKSIEIPASVTNIDYNAFNLCENLEAINVDPNNQNYTSLEGVLYTRNYETLYFCPEGKTGTITISSNTTKLYRVAFIRSKLSELTIPSNVNTIDNNCFEDAINLKSLVIPATVKTLGTGIFQKSSLESVEFQCNITEIPRYIFNNSTKLSSVNIPNTVTSIGERAFFNTNITSIDLSENITTIGDQAFGGCKELEAINVDENNSNYASIDGVLCTKDKRTLVLCPSGIKGIDGVYTMPDSITTLQGNFYECKYLSTVVINSNITKIPSRMFSYSSITYIDIPDTVTSIDYDAFLQCENLSVINIGKGVNLCYPSSFNVCLSLTEINVDSANQTYASVDGVLYNKNLTEIIRVPYARTGEFTVSETVTTIAEDAFSNCKWITIVNVPNSVNEIGEYAFANLSLTLNIDKEQDSIVGSPWGGLGLTINWLR